MSDYNRRFDAALGEIAETSVWKSNYNPPMLRSLRFLGFRPRPPHYAAFLSILLGYAAWFGPIWGAMMWFAAWRDEGFTVLSAVSASAAAGLLFGLAMAVYYAWGRKKYGLSRWQDL